jgi:hypothetical protein
VITNTDSSVNTAAGVHVEAANNNASAQIDGCTLSANATGLNAGSGAVAVRLANSNVTINTVAGVNFAGGTVFTYGDNRIRSNTNDFVGGALNATQGKQ